VRSLTFPCDGCTLSKTGALMICPAESLSVLRRWPFELQGAGFESGAFFLASKCAAAPSCYLRLLCIVGTSASSWGFSLGVYTKRLAARTLPWATIWRACQVGVTCRRSLCVRPLFLLWRAPR